MKQELRKIIREALDIDSERYVSEVPLSLYLNNVDGYFSDETAKIEWGLFTSEKTYGFSSIKPVIYKITVRAELNKMSEDKVEEFEKVYDFETGIMEGDEVDGFKLTIEKKGDSNSLFPVDISVNEDFKSIDIEFQYP